MSTIFNPVPPKPAPAPAQRPVAPAPQPRPAPAVAPQPFRPQQAAPVAPAAPVAAANPMQGCQCKNELNLDKVCIRCNQTCWQHSMQIWTEDLSTNNLCVQNSMSSNETTQALTANTVCAQSVNAISGGAQNWTADNLCSMNANINTLCVTNLNAPNFKPCNTFRAYTGFNVPFVYTLGTTINFNSILDDPNGIVTTSPTTEFTIPVSGYWSLSAFINGYNLLGSGIISGTPVASLSIQVNGVSRKSIYTPFLAFNPAFTDAIAANMFLNAGDVITAVLNILIQSSSSGLTPYVGTITLQGGNLSTTVDPTTMDIYLLSTLCSASTSPACVTCVPTAVPCSPVSNTCAVVVGPTCQPCSNM
jgi:hypothetical protein